MDSLPRESSSTSQPWIARDGTPLRIRPIAPSDEPAMIGFHRSLSDDTVYSRYFAPLKLSSRIAHDRLTHICAPDPREEIVLIAETAAANEEPRIVAVARLSTLTVGGEAEVAIVIADAYQHRGLGRELLGRLITTASDRGIGRLVAWFLPRNLAMRTLFTKLGMKIVDAPGGESVATLELPAVARAT